MNGIVINANELKHEFRDNDSSNIVLERNFKRNLKRKVIITQGKDGVILINKNKTLFAPAFTKMYR